MHSNEDLVQLGKLIEVARRAAGLSASEVASAVGISPAYMRTIERGVNPKTQRASRPALDALVAMARVLDQDAAPWLKLAGYDEHRTATKVLPARDSVDAHMRSVQESAKMLNHRGDFMRKRAFDVLKRLSNEFRLVASGTIRCSPAEEPQLTRLAAEACRQHLRAVSYQDEEWWTSPTGDRYLDLHETLKQHGVDMTRIFLVPPETASRLLPTLERHISLGIATYVISPDYVDEQHWRDVVIYDDTVLRVANPVDSDNDRKFAEFTDDPGRVVAALLDFEDLRNAAISVGGEAEQVIALSGQNTER